MQALLHPLVPTRAHPQPTRCHLLLLRPLECAVVIPKIRSCIPPSTTSIPYPAPTQPQTIDICIPTPVSQNHHSHLPCRHPRLSGKSATSCFRWFGPRACRERTIGRPAAALPISFDQVQRLTALHICIGWASSFHFFLSPPPSPSQPALHTVFCTAVPSRFLIALLEQPARVIANTHVFQTNPLLGPPRSCHRPSSFPRRPISGSRRGPCRPFACRPVHLVHPQSSSIAKTKGTCRLGPQSLPAPGSRAAIYHSEV